MWRVVSETYSKVGRLARITRLLRNWLTGLFWFVFLSVVSNSDVRRSGGPRT
jgi:hypothetical protein